MYYFRFREFITLCLVICTAFGRQTLFPVSPSCPDRVVWILRFDFAIEKPCFPITNASYTDDGYKIIVLTCIAGTLTWTLGGIVCVGMEFVGMDPRKLPEPPTKLGRKCCMLFLVGTRTTGRCRDGCRCIHCVGKLIDVDSSEQFQKISTVQILISRLKTQILQNDTRWP